MKVSPHSVRAQSNYSKRVCERRLPPVPYERRPSAMIAASFPREQRQKPTPSPFARNTAIARQSRHFFRIAGGASAESGMENSLRRRLIFQCSIHPPQNVLRLDDGHRRVPPELAVRPGCPKPSLDPLAVVEQR